MKVLITGANGFIGSALTRRLLSRGDDVRILIRPGADRRLIADLPLTAGKASKPGTVAVHEGLLTAPDALAAALEGVESIVHLAGLRRSPTRKELMDVNAGGTRALCEAAASTVPGARFVLCSSLTAMGPSRDFPDESAPLNPRDWYGESKAEAESIAREYVQALDVGIARPSRIVGPGDRENLVFFKLVAKGIRLSFGGGPRPMSTLDVDDLTMGLQLMAERRGHSGETFFLSRDTTTIEDLMAEIARHMGRKALTIHVPAAMLKLMAAGADVVTRATGKRLPLNRKLCQQILASGWTCSVAKARQELGFDPAIDLCTSVKRSLDWYRSKGWLQP